MKRAVLISGLVLAACRARSTAPPPPVAAPADSQLSSTKPRAVDASPSPDAQRLGQPKGLRLTDRAAAKVKEMSVAEKLGARLRVRVVGSDGGFLYDLFFEDQAGAMDDTFLSKGIELIVDPLSLQYLDGTEIDYVEGAAGSGFKFNNPNAAQ